MKLLSASLLLALVPGALSQNVVRFNVTKGLPGVHLSSVPSLARRGTYSEQLINNISGGGYYVQVKVGTPGQTLTMLLDTGSSDAWVLGHDADLCTDEELQGLYGMTCTDTYNPSESSSNKLVKKDGFKITYLDGGTAAGDYISDDFSVGGTTVKSLQMAYVTKAVRGTGILGLGFSISERAATKYPNIIDEMANQGLIGCKGYSLYLNDRRTDSGSILFGGIDTDKFIGPLEILPLHKPPGGNYSSFEVNFTSITVSYTNGTQLSIPTTILDHPAPAVLDSGTTLSYLPDGMVQPIYSALGTIYDPDLRMTLIDCVYLTTEPQLHLAFTFTPTLTITVPIWELILDILPPNYTPSTSPKQPPPQTRPSKTCVFGIQSTALFTQTGTLESDSKSQSPSTVNFTLLGDTFLRSAYVVYDLTHYQIGLAQANLNSTSSTIVPLSSEGTSLPTSLTGVAAQQTTYTPTPTATTRPNGENGRGSSSAAENASSDSLMRVKSLGEVLRVLAVAWDIETGTK
ncbi:acid protease [Parathielavia appendiculata]|uniref:Acid protease n=1 Tax=Parathielavia appendiculata TaxID=2587402 RepID=A0AAN6U1Q8_9PEZI|nr:acid protease [Parathielavia appendiculata]